MKTTIEFDTQDPDQEEELKRVMKAKDMALALWRTQNFLHCELDRADDKLSDEYLKGLEAAQENLLANMENLGINIDELLS